MFFSRRYILLFYPNYYKCTRVAVFHKSEIESSIHVIHTCNLYNKKWAEKGGQRRVGENRTGPKTKGQYPGNVPPPTISVIWFVLKL